jgi:hypothetical protein
MVFANKLNKNCGKLRMGMKKTFHKKLFAIALSFGLVFCLAFPGFSAVSEPKNKPELKQKETFELKPLVFRLASAETKQADFRIFPITHHKLSIPNSHISVPIQKRKPIMSSPFGDSLYTASLLTLTALNIADYVSTVKALQLPGLEEGNPIMRPFTKNMLVFGAVKLGVAALNFYLLKKIYKKNKTLGWVLSIAGNMAMSYVVSNNMRKIQSVTRH